MTLQKKDAADGRRSDAGSASANFQLESQIGERVTFLDKMARMVRENRLAAFSALLILLFILAAVFAPVLTPYGYTDMDLMHRLSAPTSAHIFGTDEGGRDILTRLLYGSRPELLDSMVRANTLYNETIEEMEADEAEGRTFVLTPSRPVGISRFEGDMEKLGQLYELGRDDMNRRMPELLAYLRNREDT